MNKKLRRLMQPNLALFFVVMALFCAAEYLRGQEREEIRERAVEMAQTSAETRRLWDCLAQQP